VGGIELDAGSLANVVAALGSGLRPVVMERGRIERQMRELALDHVRGAMDDATYLERLGHLRASLAAIDDAPEPGVRASRAVEWLRVLAETWTDADVPEAKADLLHAIYERIVVAGRRIVSVRLTTAAYANGLALALPEKVAMARPTGVGRGRTHSGSRQILIERADESECPGQALATNWASARSWASANRTGIVGTGFDIRAFHDDVLGRGVVKGAFGLAVPRALSQAEASVDRRLGSVELLETSPGREDDADSDE
jgi:hypothetical protein